MANGSWLMAQGGPGAAAEGGVGGSGNHEPLSTNRRLINELFDYIF